MQVVGQFFIYLDRYLKNTQISNVIKICLATAELFHAVGRQTVMTELIDAFSLFCGGEKTPKNPSITKKRFYVYYPRERLGTHCV